MPLKRTSHAVYETKYHLVWCPKYRKKILKGYIQERVKEIFYRISDEFGFEIDRCEVAEDHVHILLTFPPRYSISRVVGILKSISASEIFKEFPRVRKYLWGGKLWEQGYFVRTAGDKVTEEIIRRYIEEHSDSLEQPRMW